MSNPHSKMSFHLRPELGHHWQGLGQLIKIAAIPEHKDNEGAVVECEIQIPQLWVDK